MCISLSSSSSRTNAIYSELTDSLISIIGDSKHVAIYGYYQCGYRDVAKRLNKAIYSGTTSLKGCYIYSNLDARSHPHGWEIDGYKVCFAPFSAGTDYKLGLLTIVLENYRRIKRANGPIIPVLFCVSSSINSRIFSIEEAKKTERGERTFTGKELNLAYKLCYDSKLSEEIRAVAKRTFIFVKTIGVDKDSISRLEDTGIRIDDSWDEALKRPAIEKPRNPYKWFKWRDWINKESLDF